MDNVIIKLTLYIRANNAESGPPLGTTLGNIGVNTIKFCKESKRASKTKICILFLIIEKV